MSRDARALVRRVQAGLVAIIASQALLLGMAAGILIAPFSGRVAGVLSGLTVVAAVAWRSRAVWSLERAALWVEERDPALQYAFVTAVDPRYVGWAAPSYSGPLLRRAAVRALWPALVAVAVSGAVNRAAEVYGDRLFGRPNRHVGSVNRSASTTFNRLAPLTVRVEPPAYSHLSSRDLTEPRTVSSLVGSRIVVRGRGDTAGIRAVVQGESVRVAADGGAWAATLLMPPMAAVLRLSDGAYERLVVLTPVPDAPPVVELTAPARDSVMRTARGVLPLAARASDDIGLADGHFEIIVSSGSEESGGVQGKTLAAGQIAFGDARTGTMAGGFRLDSLKPGDVMSIRAVVRDNNIVSGPGIGASETRTYRLATKEEYDSIAVEGAPPPAIDSSFLSQRMMERRLYLRGKPPTIIVNLSRVRMTGTSAPDPGLRASQVAGDTVRRRLVAELGTILRGPLGGPSVADSLTLMEPDAMAVDPAVAGALGDAVRALQAGQDPTPALARVRRSLSGPASVNTSHAAWAGGGRE